MYFVVDSESVDLVACAPILGPLPANLVQLEALLKPDPLQSVATVKIILENQERTFPQIMGFLLTFVLIC